MRLKDGSWARCIGGTVSPAGGNFEEPVTQGTLKVVGAFHGLSRERSDARRFPAIDPLDSWSQYPGVVSAEQVGAARVMLHAGNDVNQMMKVVGEEGTSIDDFVVSSRRVPRRVYLQQDAYHDVDGAPRPSGSARVRAVRVRQVRQGGAAVLPALTQTTGTRSHRIRSNSDRGCSRWCRT